ncbi:XRE family transcriptional regulator [Flavobacterium beibuense]|uniref:XRE family transcriptional regulator n=2 Tax=Flavobacterium beibuense TaxID=657326 RepID=A0A444WER1_9FLAO|nr:XRE family transcriptional regulator [Flavobacterium beibuense]
MYELSQEDLAKALELSRLTIRKLEEGHNATLDTLLKVINHFDMLGELYAAIDRNISDNNIISLY